jgi:hypothetical protein
MNTTTNTVTPTTKASSITELLSTLGKLMLKDPKNAEWLDMGQLSHICRERGLTLDGKYPTTDELETALRKLFGDADEFCVDGISVTGYYRRVGWDLVFMVRFYPDVHRSPVTVGSMATDELQTVHNN